MLGPNLLRNEPDAVAEKLARRGFKLDVDKLGALEERRKALQVKTENLRVECNPRLKSIGQAKARGEDIKPLRLKTNKPGEELDAAEAKLDTLQAEIRNIALTTPDSPTDEVPVGKNESDNVEVNRQGTPCKFGFEVRDHVTLGEMYSGLDFIAAVKLTGSRFAVIRGQIACMHRVLPQFMLNLYIEQCGYSENHTPYLVSQGTLYGAGQLPKSAGDPSHTRPLEEETDTSNYALIPTTEAPLTNLVRDEIIDEDNLPIKMTTHTLCPRSEASLYDRDARSLIRTHQFDKVEVVWIVRPEDSMATLEGMTGHMEEVPQLSGPPYHKIILCTDDMGLDACKTYNLEVWISIQSTYHEISSCSSVWDFQTRRMQMRCRSKSDKKTRPVYTLNGPGLVVGRMLAVVIENYQQANGHTEVPETLCPHMNGLEHVG